MPMPLTLVSAYLLQQQKLIATPLDFTVNDFSCRIQSNSAELLDKLQDYFKNFSDFQQPSNFNTTLIAIQNPALKIPENFGHWQTFNAKEIFIEFDQARLIRKLRTEMLFLQSQTLKIASGDCLSYLNQLINFINAQYIANLLHQQWLCCHAGAIVINNKALAIAGVSGSGKSTLLLEWLKHTNCYYVSNDRLLIRREAEKILACGIPKLPRVNPGTIVNNFKLWSLISPPQRAEYLALSPDKLRQLTQKFDVDVVQLYQKPLLTKPVELAGFLVLNAQTQSAQALQIQRQELTQRPDLLAIIRKSPDIFYQDSNGYFPQISESLDSKDYLQTLATLPLHEVTGQFTVAQLRDSCPPLFIF